MANLVCPYPPKKTIISGGTVFAVFDLGQIAYQGPVRPLYDKRFQSSDLFDFAKFHILVMQREI